jgi:hypothetical protein
MRNFVAQCWQRRFHRVRLGLLTTVRRLRAAGGMYLRTLELAATRKPGELAPSLACEMPIPKMRATCSSASLAGTLKVSRGNFDQFPAQVVRATAPVSRSPGLDQLKQRTPSALSRSQPLNLAGVGIAVADADQPEQQQQQREKGEDQIQPHAEQSLGQILSNAHRPKQSQRAVRGSQEKRP